MAAAVSMQAPGIKDDPKVKERIQKQEQRLTLLVNRQYQLHSQCLYLDSSGTWETLKRKWSCVDTLEKLMRFRPVEVTQKKTNSLRASLWKQTQKERNYGKQLEQQIKLCEEDNAKLTEHVKKLLNQGISHSISNDWDRLKSLPNNMEQYVLDNPQVPAGGFVALMLLACIVGRPCH